MKTITKEEQDVYIETAKVLKGSERRKFMARVVKALGHGGQLYAEQTFQWSRETITKGKHELRSGLSIVDNFSARGTKRVEEKLPNLLEDIKSVVDDEAQTDPTFKTTQLFTRITAREVLNRLIKQKGYSEEELPTEVTIRKRLNELGYSLKKVTKTKPKKKFLKLTKSLKI